MSMILKKLEEEARQLTQEERAKLVEHLISTLDSGEDIDSEKAWVDEAEKRYKQFQEGTLQASPAEDVFENAFKRLNEKY